MIFKCEPFLVQYLKELVSNKNLWNVIYWLNVNVNIGQIERVANAIPEEGTVVVNDNKVVLINL